MLRNCTRKPAKRLKVDTGRQKSVMSFSSHETEIYVRGENVPRNRSSVSAYLKAAAGVKNVIGPKKSQMREQSFFKELVKVEYQPVPSRTQFIENYVKEFHKKYQDQMALSHQQLESKLRLAKEQYQSLQQSLGAPPAEQAADGSDAKEDQKLTKLLRKIENEHSPKITDSPGSPNAKYVADSVRMLASQRTICFSVDVEAYERNTNVVTEIGISVFDPRESMYSTVGNFRTFHLIVGESLRLRNGRFVCDVKDCFLLGESYVMSLSSCVEFIQTLLNYYMVPHTPQERTWHRAFVGHNVKGDLKWLSSIGVNLPANIGHDALSLDPKLERISILDTEKLYRVMYGSKGSSLGKILRLFKIPHAYLHNAGNDAYFTLKLLLHMCDVNYRRRLQMDDFYAVTATVEEWSRREKNKGSVNSHGKGNHEFTEYRSRRKQSLHTEFGGCRWFASASDALVGTPKPCEYE